MLNSSTIALCTLLFLGGSAAAQCVGDCSGDNVVTVGEIVTGVGIVLGTQLPSLCPAFANPAGRVDIAQLVRGVNNLLNGCPAVDTPTSTPSSTSTVTPQSTSTATATVPATFTLTPTFTPTGTEVPTVTATVTPTLTGVPTGTATATVTPSSSPALGQRVFIIDPGVLLAPAANTGTGIFTTGLSGSNAATEFSPGPLVLVGGVPGMDGIASLTLKEDVTLDITLVDSSRFCIKLDAASSMGQIDCDGGTAYDVNATREPGQPGLAFTFEAGQGEAAGPGNGQLVVTALLELLPSGITTPCAQVTYTNPPLDLAFTTATGTATVAETVLSLSVAGEPFDCRHFSLPGSGGRLAAPLPMNLAPIGDVSNVIRLAEPSSGLAICGNMVVESDEECDDGNNFGGDGCAANCTDEIRRVSVFDPSRSIATIQTEGFPVITNLTGLQTFRLGKLRASDTLDPEGDVIFKANEMPATIRASEFLFDPVRVTGLVCACVRGVPVDSFGPGNSGSGSVGCADGVLSDVSYRLVQDHNTTPGSAGNRLSVETGTPDDPECDDVTTLPGGATSSACTEGDPSVERCANDPGMEEEHPHIGVCNGPRQFTRYGGPAPKGSAFILFNTAIALLQDRGLCASNPRLPNGQCEFSDYGPDCQPCTGDDLEQGTVETIPLTTAEAQASVVDANNSESVQAVPNASVQIDEDADCLGPCMTVVTGALFDCDEILRQGASLTGGALAGAFPSVDAATIGDNVTTIRLFSQ